MNVVEEVHTGSKFNFLVDAALEVKRGGEDVAAIARHVARIAVAAFDVAVVAIDKLLEGRAGDGLGGVERGQLVETVGAGAVQPSLFVLVNHGLDARIEARPLHILVAIG